MKDNKIKAWALERYILGDLPRKEIKEIENQLEKDSRLREVVERLKKSNKEILNQYPPDSVIPKILSRYKEESSKEENIKRIRSTFFKRLLYASPVLASALVLLFIILHRPAEDTRIKGIQTVDITKPQIIICRKITDEVEVLKSGDRSKVGDLLQIAYVPAGKIYGVIFSIDGNGTVTLHYPEDNNKSSLLEQKQKVFLGSSYELDDAPKFERFFFITAMSEINVQEILERAKAFANSLESAEKGILTLPDTYSQFSIILKKGEER